MTLMLNVQEAHRQFFQLLDWVQQGEQVVIAESGRPVVRLVLVTSPVAPREPGSATGQIVIAEDFDAPLPESILGAFEQ